jgi:predicted secreted hydrolase
MTNSLSQTQTGWDWLGIMLRDGRNLMVFRLRDNKGETDFASGTILSVAEGSKALKGDQFSLKPIEYWTSAKTSARYPVVWRLIVESEGIDLVLKARVPDSEIGHTASDLSVNKGAERIVYWEGPVASSDESALGYLEMTGYQAPIAGFSGN